MKHVMRVFDTFLAGFPPSRVLRSPATADERTPPSQASDCTHIFHHGNEVVQQPTPHFDGEKGTAPANATQLASTGLPLPMLLLRVATRPLAPTDPPAAVHVAVAAVALSRHAQGDCERPAHCSCRSAAAAAVPVPVNGHRRLHHDHPAARARAPPIFLPQHARLCFPMAATPRVPQRPCLSSPASDCSHPPPVPRSVAFYVCGVSYS